PSHPFAACPLQLPVENGGIVAISLKPSHWKRYKDIAWLLLKYGRRDLGARGDLEEELTREESVSPADDGATAEQLARDLEKLGPTFIKIGQLLSTRSDLLSPPFLEALSRLPDSVEP